MRKTLPKKKNNLSNFGPYYLVPLLNLFLIENMEYWTTLNYIQINKEISKNNIEIISCMVTWQNNNNRDLPY